MGVLALSVMWRMPLRGAKLSPEYCMHYCSASKKGCEFGMLECDAENTVEVCA